MFTTQEDILNDVKIILGKKMGAADSDVYMDAKLEDDLDLDSLDKVELCMEVEKRFNITLPSDEAEDFVTVGDVVRSVEQKIDNAGGNILG